MRRTASKNDVSVKAYAGTTGILLGILSCKACRASGFALERLDGRSGKGMNLTECYHSAYEA